MSILQRITCLIKGHRWDWKYQEMARFRHLRNVCWRCGKVRARERVSYTDEDEALVDYRTKQANGTLYVVPHEEVRKIFGMPRDP